MQSFRQIRLSRHMQVVNLRTRIPQQPMHAPNTTTVERSEGFFAVAVQRSSNLERATPATNECTCILQKLLCFFFSVVHWFEVICGLILLLLLLLLTLNVFYLYVIWLTNVKELQLTVDCRGQQHALLRFPKDQVARSSKRRHTARRRSCSKNLRPPTQSSGSTC